VSLGRAPRVAIVGVRRVRTGLGRFFAKHLVARGASVPAFLGTRPETVAAAREILSADGIEASGFTSLDELLAAVPVDALAIASPHETHVSWLERALAAGLHVICEKPLVWGVDDAAGHAARIVRDFHAKGLVLHENCPWPMTLPAFDALHPGARAAGVRDFAMWLSPYQPGAAMMLDSISHPLSLLQALTGADDAAIEGLSFSTRDPAAARLEAHFRFVAGSARVSAIVRLQAVREQPRPAGYAVNGFPAERQVRMSDYALSFADGGRVVPVPDPMAEVVGRFVDAVRSGEPEAEARSERRRIVSRMRMLEEMVAALSRSVRT
jgi:predicted dehydrogenase